MLETRHDVAFGRKMLGHLRDGPLGTGLTLHRLIVGNGDSDLGGRRINLIN